MSGAMVALTLAKVAGGGVLIGLACGIVAIAIAGRTSDHLVETALTAVAAYGSSANLAPRASMPKRAGVKHDPWRRITSASERVSRSTSHGDVRVKGCEIQWRMSKTPLAASKV